MKIKLNNSKTSKIMFYATFMLLLSCTQHTPYQKTSIQGKQYPDRINSVYDPSISNADIQKFLDLAKKAVSTNDPNIIANIFAFPLRCNFAKQRIIIKSKKEFLKHYSKIINNIFIQAILNANINDLFVNQYGFAIGKGGIWFDPTKGITTINYTLQYNDLT